MKRLLIIPLCLLCLAGVKYRAKYFRAHTSGTTTPEQNSSSASSTFYITSTGVDTSRVLALNSDDISLEITVTDTSSGGDSAQVKVVIMSALRRPGDFPSNFNRFVRKDSITVSNETPTHKVYLTPNSTTLPRALYHVVELTGGADNKKASASSVIVSANYITK